MGAWNKLFSDKNRVSSSITRKGSDGVTKSVKLVVGCAGFGNDEWAEAAKSGATLSQSVKEIDESTGDTIQKKSSIKAGDITPKESVAAVREILGMPEDVPNKVKERGKSVEPSANGTAGNDGAARS